MKYRYNRRKRTFLLLLLCVALLATVAVSGVLLAQDAARTDFSIKNQMPSRAHLFGTDWMGRDMLSRTLTGLSMSIRIGLATAVVSAVVSLLLGSAAALSRRADHIVTYCIDLVMGVPHILLLILVSLACGKGLTGVVLGVTLTHWTSLARVLRGEILQLRSAPYIQVAAKLGQSKWAIARRHLLPHLLPQFLTGLVLQFPHAILHESSLTFLGFGLSPEQPAIGNILSEGMSYLTTGKWWLALFPGLALVITVALFAALGEGVRRLLEPATAHE